MARHRHERHSSRKRRHTEEREEDDFLKEELEGEKRHSRRRYPQYDDQEQGVEDDPEEEESEEMQEGEDSGQSRERSRSGHHGSKRRRKKRGRGKGREMRKNVFGGEADLAGWGESMRRWSARIVYILCGTGIIIGALFASFKFGLEQGRTEVKEKIGAGRRVEEERSAPERSVREHRQALEKIDLAFEAYRETRYDAAEKYFREALELNPGLGEIEYFLGKLALKRKDPEVANTHMTNCIKNGHRVAAAFNVRGQLRALRKQFTGAYADFERATAEDPFGPDSFFYWGEVLRQAGRPREAARRYYQAACRGVDESEEFIINIKLLLARVESEEPATLQQEIEKVLELDPPPGEWLLAAAALDLRENRIDAATTRLIEARQALQPGFFYWAMSDPFFDFYQQEERLQEFFRAPPGAVRPARTDQPAGLRRERQQKERKVEKKSEEQKRPDEDERLEAEKRLDEEIRKLEEERKKLEEEREKLQEQKEREE